MSLVKYVHNHEFETLDYFPIDSITCVVVYICIECGLEIEDYDYIIDDDPINELENEDYL